MFSPRGGKEEEREREGGREGEEEERGREGERGEIGRRESKGGQKTREHHPSFISLFYFLPPSNQKLEKRRRTGTSFSLSHTRLFSFSPSPSLTVVPLQKGLEPPMPSRALALPSAAALLTTVKTTMASIAPSLYAAVGAAVAFLLGLRLVFGTLASCLPFGCKVRTREERVENERRRRETREVMDVSIKRPVDGRRRRTERDGINFFPRRKKKAFRLWTHRTRVPLFRPRV